MKYERAFISASHNKILGVSKEGSVLKVDTTKEIFFDMTQSWRFAKVAELENKGHQTTRGMSRRKGKK